MKKIFFLILALILLFTLFTFTGCGKSNRDNKDKEDNKIVCSVCTEEEMSKYQLIYKETGINPVIDASNYTYKQIEENGETITKKIYTDVVLNYYATGFGHYCILTTEEFLAIQEYQNRTGRQVLYPTVKLADRPTLDKNRYDANIYYVTEDPQAATISPKLDKNGNVIPNYWAYKAEGRLSALIAEYNSLRIEGEDGFIGEDGERYYYAYGRKVDGGIEVRVLRYEFYMFLKDANPELSPPEEYFYFWNSSNKT